MRRRNLRRRNLRRRNLRMLKLLRRLAEINLKEVRS